LADLFPPMGDEEYRALCDDIAAHGQLEPIVLLNGLVLDGRHRARACAELGIPPRTVDYTGDAPASYVLSRNLRRRNLTSDQRAAIALAALPALEAEAKARQLATLKQNADSKPVGEIVPQRSADAAAQAAGTNERYVKQLKRIQRTDPDAVTAIARGQLRLTDYVRREKEATREARRDANREKIAATSDPLAGRYATILLDPPWDWGDEGDADQFGRARPTYGTMPYSGLLALPVPTLADDDCHLYLWITNRSLPKGFDLIEHWGFRYVTALTWCKPSIGMGNYFRGQTEHVLFAVKGSQPLKRRDVGTWFQAPRGAQHSSKPAVFYDLIESCSPGPYIELFARAPRTGWAAWGADAA
jgi:N6-adenosine-specific RNA methylase IME4/ParB-like chromosome segregation protein Spo0J